MNTASYHNNQAIWTELLPGGHHWSGRIQKGTILRFTSLGAQANVSLFCVNAADVLERFNMPSVGGHTAERVEHSDMVFVKDLDATSPKLWEACSAGYTFDEVQIDFYRANGDKRIKYLQIKLKHVLVSSVTPTVNEEGVPTEAFGLKYAAVEWTYNQQDINGTAKGAVTKKWSLSNNTASYAA